jgi:CheY-like chemotaxis protein
MSAWTIHISKVLVATGSAVLRDTLSRILTRHAGQVIAVSGFSDGLDRVAENADIGLVIADIALADGDGFRLLDHVRRLEEPRPGVILVAGRRSDEDARRAMELGAIGFLVKPICFRDILGLIRNSAAPLGARGLRRRWCGRACLLEQARTDPRGGEGSQIFWYLRDVSSTGAFVETEAPLPLGSRLELSLDIDGQPVRVSAEVVRVQEPGWGRPGGVGVRFVDFAPGVQ